MKKIEYTAELGLTGYNALIYAIIEQACLDYEKAIRRNDVVELSRLEHFFHSQWFAFLTNLDGDYLMKIVRDRLYETSKKNDRKRIKIRDKK